MEGWESDLPPDRPAVSSEQPHGYALGILKVVQRPPDAKKDNLHLNHHTMRGHGLRWSALCVMVMRCDSYTRVPFHAPLRTRHATFHLRGGASPPESSVAGNERDGMPSEHPLEEFLRVASPPARVMATAFLNKRKSATSDAARKIIDEFLLEELMRLAALPAAPADGTPVNQFLAEWRTFTYGAEWQEFMRQHSHRDVALAWNQWRAFGAEHDRALPLLAEDTASDRDSWRQQYAPDEDRIAAAMEDAGVVRLDAILSQATAVELRRYILAERDRADVARDSGVYATSRQGDSLSRVLSPSNSGSGSGPSKGEATTTRWDVRLPWDALVERAVHEMLAGPLGEALHALSGGGEAPLFECAAIVSAEGAAPQVLHSDTVLTDGLQLFTAFVAMQDIAPHMGPTRFLPATHQGADCASSHNKNARGEMELCEKAVSVSALDMHAGDCTLYDSRLLHCGGAHRAAPPATPSSERVLFYVSFQHTAASKRPEMRLIEDEDNSILPAVAALDMRLGTLRSAL